MTTITHPYKGKIERHEARISFDASKADFEFVFRQTLPLRNAPNAVMASLFHAFCNHLRKNKSKLPPYDIDNEQLVRQYLQRCTFGDNNDAGHKPAVGRRASTVRSKNKGTPSIPANTQIQDGERVC